MKTTNRSVNFKDFDSDTYTNLKIQIQKRFNDFTLEINMKEAGKRIGILGASGCGKSMLLKSIAGIVSPDEGRIEIGQRILFDSKNGINVSPQNRRVGYLFQNYALFPNMTVVENIAAGIRGNKKTKEEIVQKAVERFRLKGLEKHLPSQLSGGQQQRVALARILVYRPDVILLDEPFSALDEHLKFSLQEELLEMTSDYEGIMIMVSHSPDEIYFFSDRMWIMHEGKVVCADDTKTVFQAPENIIAAKITGCKNIFKVQYLDEHFVWVEELDMAIHFEKTVRNDIKAIGYHADDFIPIWENAAKNAIPVQIAHCVKLPFETNYYIQTKSKIPIVWTVKKDKMKELSENGYPKFLKLEEERILFLYS